VKSWVLSAERRKNFEVAAYVMNPKV